MIGARPGSMLRRLEWFAPRPLEDSEKDQSRWGEGSELVSDRLLVGTLIANDVLFSELLEPKISSSVTSGPVRVLAFADARASAPG